MFFWLAWLLWLGWLFVVAGFLLVMMFFASFLVFVELVCLAFHLELGLALWGWFWFFVESLILAQDERWRRA